jgi:hypothetical protein
LRWARIGSKRSGASQAAPLQLARGARQEPTFNRISGDIAYAVKQFDAVNPDRAVPTFLVLINWADATDYLDLEETFTGRRQFELESGKQLIATMPNISEGRMIGEPKRRIDLYVWIDGRTQQVQGPPVLRKSSFPA